MKDIECSDLISTRYLSEIDEFLVSTLNLCPSFSSGVFMVLHLSGALVVHHLLFDTLSLLFRTVCHEALALHGLIFRFFFDDTQRRILQSLILSLTKHEEETWLFDFFSNPQRSHHHAVDYRTHNSVTECCFSYILNGRVTHFPGIHDWASKSKLRPWLWRLRKPTGVITDIQRLRWRQREPIGYSSFFRPRNKKLEPFWALVLALKYLPYLLDKATSSGELIALANIWSYRYPLLVWLFPHDTKKAGRAVERYLSCFDGEEQCESEVAVGPPPLSNVLKLKFVGLFVCLTPPSEPSFQHVRIARELATSVTERLPHSAGSFLHLQPFLAHFSAPIATNFEILKYSMPHCNTIQIFRIWLGVMDITTATIYVLYTA
jgi:hypothetical protein